VINVSGHRLGTAEIEDAIDEHEWVIETAVVGYPHDIKGQGIYAFVICDGVEHDEDYLKKEILKKVTKIIGPIAKPDKIQIVNGLPKTRSGKIMRRILRKIAEGGSVVRSVGSWLVGSWQNLSSVKQLQNKTDRRGKPANERSEARICNVRQADR
jgi:acyl-coenzyme A synthetase/AMP-(fatty) acid ligase